MNAFDLEDAILPIWRETASKVLESAASATGVTHVFVPPHVSFMARRGDTTITLVEHEPGPKTILFEGKPYNISLPYIYFVFVRKNGRTFKYVFAGKSRINSLNHVLYAAPLPNVFGDGSVCMSNEADPEKYIKRFWNSSFTSDVVDNLDILRNVVANPNLSNFNSRSILEIWADETKNNSNYWKKIDRMQRVITLGEFVEEHLPPNSKKLDFERNVQKQVEIAVKKSVTVAMRVGKVKHGQR
jgi:hypothetical protein